MARIDSDYRDRPIPKQDGAATALDYKGVPVNLAGARAGEPLVDVAEYAVAGTSYYARNDGFNPPYHRHFAAGLPSIWTRRSVAERLAEVNRTLARYDVELYALNAYRPIALQRELWDFFIDRARKALSDPSEASRIEFAGKYCSDPRGFDRTNPKTWPAHVTGGAVDTAMRNRATGEFLFMGGIFDDPDSVSHTAHFEDADPASGVSAEEAKRNRRLLYWAMAKADFANYPYEWWHFDWGTQLWVLDGGRVAGKRPAAAFYGPAEPPGE
jgi:D-alanyl-D-alanine dipeptidase